MPSIKTTLEWIDERIQERQANSKIRERANFDPSVPIVNAGLFTQQIADLAETSYLRGKRAL